MMRFNRFMSAIMIFCTCLIGFGVTGSSLCLADNQVTANCHTDYNTHALSFHLQLDHVTHRYLRIMAYHSLNFQKPLEYTVFPLISLEMGRYISHGNIIDDFKPVSDVIKNADGTYSGTLSIYPYENDDPRAESAFNEFMKYPYLEVYLYDFIPNPNSPRIPVATFYCH